MPRLLMLSMVFGLTFSVLSPLPTFAEEQIEAFTVDCGQPKYGTSAEPPLTWDRVKGNLLSEWARFGYRTVQLSSPDSCAITKQGKTEDTDEGTISDVQKYFRAVGHLKSAKAVRCEESGPWSAVFISWVFVESGAVLEPKKPTGQGQFCAHEGHAAYVWHMARQARLRKDGPTFKVHDAAKKKPAIGDLICAERPPSGFKIGKYLDGNDSTRNSHCDIVVDVRPGFAYAIGGNVQDGVAMTITPLHPDGTLMKIVGWRNWQVVVEHLYPGAPTPLDWESYSKPDGYKGKCLMQRRIVVDMSLREDERCLKAKNPY